MNKEISENKLPGRIRSSFNVLGRSASLYRTALLGYSSSKYLTSPLLSLTYDDTRVF